MDVLIYWKGRLNDQRELRKRPDNTVLFNGRKYEVSPNEAGKPSIETTQPLPWPGPKWIRGYRAVGSGHGVMTDSVRGATYFFPNRETAELWAGGHGTVIERDIRIDTAGRYAVREGGLSDHVGDTHDVVLRMDPSSPKKIIEILVFKDQFMK